MISIKKFNEQHKVGSMISYTYKGVETMGITRWAAEKTEKGRSIIWIHGKIDAIDLRDVIWN